MQHALPPLPSPVEAPCATGVCPFSLTSSATVRVSCDLSVLVYVFSQGLNWSVVRGIHLFGPDPHTGGCPMGALALISTPSAHLKPYLQRLAQVQIQMT
jgi:hypothetical protein